MESPDCRRSGPGFRAAFGGAWQADRRGTDQIRNRQPRRRRAISDHYSRAAGRGSRCRPGVDAGMDAGSRVSRRVAEAPEDVTTKTAHGATPWAVFSSWIYLRDYFLKPLTRTCAISGKAGPSIRPSVALAFVFLRATQRPIGRWASTISSSTAAPEAGITSPFVADGTLIDPFFRGFELPGLAFRSKTSSSLSSSSVGVFLAVRSGVPDVPLFLGLMAIGVASFVGCKAVVVVGAVAGTPSARLLPMGTVLNTVTGRCVTISWLTIRTVFTATLR